MSTKTLSTFLAFLAACGVNSEAPTDVVKPLDDDGRGRHFCCTETAVEHQLGVEFTECVAISVEEINSCDVVLACGDKWVKRNGKVTCL